jgi:anti-anti-sigma factor
MPLTFSPSVENEIAILELEGSLTLSPALHQLGGWVNETLKSGKLRGLILYLASVGTADSAGLGELTRVYTLTSRQGTQLVLAAPNQNLRTMLQVTHLDGLLTVCKDLASALSFVNDNAAGIHT